MLIATSNVEYSIADTTSETAKCEKVFRFVGNAKSRSSSISSIEHARRKACLSAYSTALMYFESYSFCIGNNTSLTIDSNHIEKHVKDLNQNYFECVLKVDEEIYKNFE